MVELVEVLEQFLSLGLATWFVSIPGQRVASEFVDERVRVIDGSG
ncbi:hypothetical protein RSSM_02490 [Rhodopirellula sallentina SM41]|uniref:Uncharacterized protein n=1 Tax=Rhodopirellula sallentina SM41 TaxID=1263870 RepID=M5U3P7_9BACT|nr:hypothetical protein RSSM_02490 [Rhodopirellula sallentina SM41]